MLTDFTEFRRDKKLDEAKMYNKYPTSRLREEKEQRSHRITKLHFILHWGENNLRVHAGVGILIHEIE